MLRLCVVHVHSSAASVGHRQALSASPTVHGTQHLYLQRPSHVQVGTFCESYSAWHAALILYVQRPSHIQLLATSLPAQASILAQLARVATHVASCQCHSAAASAKPKHWHEADAILAVSKPLQSQMWADMRRLSASAQDTCTQHARCLTPARSMHVACQEHVTSKFLEALCRGAAVSK